jgi:hypothetical protein
MRSRLNALGRFALLLWFGSIASGQNAEVSQLPTWQDEIAKGFVPYHQLTVDDFRIDDQSHGESVYFISAFIHPNWHYLTTGKDGWWYAYVDRWIVLSGLDKNGTSRKSKFREMKAALPHAQAYVDIYEIHGRQLAALKPGELPSARGATPPEAIEILTKSVNAFLQEKYKLLEAEAAEFQEATKHGANMKKVKELAKAIRKRLDALPAPTGPGYELPAATASPSPTPSPKK